MYGCGDAWASRELFIHFYKSYYFIYNRNNYKPINYNNIMQWISTFPTRKIHQKVPTRARTVSHPKTQDNINKIIDKTEQFHVYHPDGTFLFLCNRRKRDWFIEKKFAEINEDKPDSITLIYKENEKESRVKYRLNDDEVRCYVCGSKTNYMSHHIVYNI